MNKGTVNYFLRIIFFLLFKMANNSTSNVRIGLSTIGDDHRESDSDDSELDEPQPQPTVEEQIDPVRVYFNDYEDSFFIFQSQLQWLPWMWYYTKKSAKRTYEVCDAAGEKLAWFFGITKPKYYAEIQEYERMDEEVNSFLIIQTR